MLWTQLRREYLAMPIGEGGEELEKVVQIVRFSVTLLVVKRGE